MEISYLDDLKMRVFEFVYFKLVHRISRPKQEEGLQKEIAALSDDERAYVSSFVEECMRDIQAGNVVQKK